jgi:spermidine synthase
MHWLSYIYPQTLYKKQTKYGSALLVEESSGRINFYIDRVLQSGPWFQSMWRDLFLYILPYIPIRSPSLLLLGLGGGDLVKYLESTDKTWTIDAIEREQEIIGISKTYFGLIPSLKLRLYCGDAHTYIRNFHHSYGCIVLDLYGGDRVPVFVDDPVYLSKLSRLLMPGGVLVLNYASRSFGEKELCSFERILNHIFSSVQRLSVHGHTFFMARGPYRQKT